MLLLKKLKDEDMIEIRSEPSSFLAHVVKTLDSCLLLGKIA